MKLATGIESLDEVLDGGFAKGSLVEFYGNNLENNTLYHQLAVQMGMLGKKSLFIADRPTCIFFRHAMRCKARRFGLDTKESMLTVTVKEGYDGYKIDELLESLQNLLEEYADYGLIVIDDYRSLFDEAIHTVPLPEPKWQWGSTRIRNSLKTQESQEKLSRLLGELKTHVERTGAIVIVACSDRHERHPHDYAEVDLYIRTKFRGGDIVALYMFNVRSSPVIKTYSGVSGFYDTLQELKEVETEVRDCDEEELWGIFDLMTQHRHAPRSPFSYVQNIEDAMSVVGVTWDNP